MAILALCLSCCVLGAWLALRLRRFREALRGRAYNARGKRGERDAERLLLAHGCRICERQARVRYDVSVDGVLQQVDLVLDFVVEHAGERIVAEVKTGTSSPKLARAETRRQLLEYQLATGTSRVLLVDPEAGVITEVGFPLAQHGQPSAARTWAALAWLVPVAVLAWYWSRLR